MLINVEDNQQFTYFSNFKKKNNLINTVEIFEFYKFWFDEDYHNTWINLTLIKFELCVATHYQWQLTN